MRLRVSFLLAAAALVLTSCSDRGGEVAVQSIDIRPDQFALLPCGDTGEHACALAIAGGKRLLIGAPAGAAKSMRPDDLRLLDAVMIFSLAANDLEGLDEVRNASWHAGRSEPLRVIGPAGLEEVVTALNKAYEQADALFVVRNGIPPGGYDAAIITAVTARSGQVVFDTGDLTVRRIASGYEVEYAGTGAVRLQACRRNDRRSATDEAAPVAMSVGCSASENDLVWPITKPVFVSEN